MPSSGRTRTYAHDAVGRRTTIVATGGGGARQCGPATSCRMPPAKLVQCSRSGCARHWRACDLWRRPPPPGCVASAVMGSTPEDGGFRVALAFATIWLYAAMVPVWTRVEWFLLRRLCPWQRAHGDCAPVGPQVVCAIVAYGVGSLAEGAAERAWLDRHGTSPPVEVFVYVIAFAVTLFMGTMLARGLSGRSLVDVRPATTPPSHTVLWCRCTGGGAVQAAIWLAIAHGVLPI